MRQGAPMIPVSWGELLDKISILEVKRRNISAANKLTHVCDELAALYEVCERSLPREARIDALVSELKAINAELWDLEDQLRVLDRAAIHDERFVGVARIIRVRNDRRAQIKLAINEVTRSPLVEQKHYSTDDAPVTKPLEEVAS
jgi:uncharacterized protein DUF6165